MQIQLTDEQRAFRESCGRLAADLAAGWHRGRGPGDVDAPTPNDKAWSRIADAGWLALGLREENGGIGATTVDAGVLAEQLGYYCVAAPVLGTLIAAEQLQTWQAPADVLEQVAAGVLRLAPALTPDLRHFAATEPADTVPSVTGPAVTGPPGTEPAHAVPAHAAPADAAPTAAAPGSPDATPAGVLAWDCAGAELAVLPSQGRAYRLGDPTGFADLTRAVRPLAGPDRDLDLTAPDVDAAARVRAFGLSLLVADLLGTMQAALDAAVEHAKARNQFGAPIGSFGAVQQLLADCHVLVETTRSASYYVGWATDALPGRRALRAARAAKAFASRSAVEVCETVIQVYGGIGMTWEAPAHVWLRRAQSARIVLGDEHHHQAVIAAAEFTSVPRVSGS